MSPKTFEAPTMAAALAQVKRELGRDAVILRTRTVQRRGLMGLGSRTFVEITARREAGGPERQEPRRRDIVESPRKAAVAVRASCGRADGHGAAPADGDLRRELADIKSLVLGLVRDGARPRLVGLSPQSQQAYLKLIQNQVEEDIAAQLVERIESARISGQPASAEELRGQLLQQVAGILKSACPIAIDGAGRGIVAFVGPTGVGKTTTLAKLAAQLHLRDKRRVGLITLDTYRIAAVDQLRTYAKIIGVPLEVALEPAEVQPALSRLERCDVVLIDTAGRSQFDGPRLAELRLFLQAARPTETHLVLPACGSHAVLMKAVEQFGLLDIDRVLFTKIDEAVGIGTMLGVMRRVQARLSYMTTGQDVPDDIEPCDSGKLAQLIVDGGQAGTEC